MPEVTIEWLNKEAHKLVKKYWNLKEIPEIKLANQHDKLSIDHKLDWDKSIGYVGYYCSSVKLIVMNNEVNVGRELKYIRRTLLHELCHWKLHTDGLPWHDHDERFARELIRVGLGKYHNRDELSVSASKKARKNLKKEFFDIVEKCGDGEVITSRVRHPRKNSEDFKADLANCLIRLYHLKKNDDDCLFTSDVVDKLCEWYGYKCEPIAEFTISLVEEGSWSDVGHEDNISGVLRELELSDDEIINKLEKDAFNYSVASENNK